MTYNSLTQKINSLPEYCLDEIENYIEYVLFKVKKESDLKNKNNLSKYFGSINIKEDGLSIQKALRDEWN